MNQKIKEHVTKYAEMKGYQCKTEDDIIRLIRDSDAVWEGNFDKHRHWQLCLTVVEIDGMLIGFENAKTTGDESAEDKGWVFDPKSICEVKAETKTVTIYNRVG